MSKFYRVHIHDHGDQGRWLAQHDFTKRPDREQIEAAFPVLAEPGRYEVRVNVVWADGNEGRLAGWLQGEYVKDPANPTDAELFAAVKRGLTSGKLVDAADWLAEPRLSRDADAPAAETEILRKDVPVGDGAGWLVRRNGQLFVISHTDYMNEPTTQAFRVREPSMEITDWDEVAGGRGMTKEQVLAELTQRPTDDDGIYVMSPRDELERAGTKARIRAQQEADARLAEADAKGAPYVVGYYGVSYHDAVAIANSQHPSRVLANTNGYRFGRFTEQDDGTVVVDMMGSRIAEFDEDGVKLSSCGWVSPTTSEALSQLVTGGYFYTDKGVIKFSAYETTGSQRLGHPFTDGQRFGYGKQAGCCPACEGTE
jgi:hypothetical protein